MANLDMEYTCIAFPKYLFQREVIRACLKKEGVERQMVFHRKVNFIGLANSHSQNNFSDEN